MNLKTLVLTGLGFIFLGLGAIGVFLPLLPTTPFVLVALTCFSSTPRIRRRVMRISFFKDYIECYEDGVGISKKTFWKSMFWLWGMLVISMISIRNLWVSFILLIIGLAVTTHILLMARDRREYER